MQTQTQANKNGSYGASDFAPIDATAIEPDGYPGGYRFKIIKASVGPDRKHPELPQLQLQVKAVSVLADWEDDTNAQKTVGSTHFDRMTFRPNGDRTGNMAKRQFAQLVKATGIDSDVIPAGATRYADFNELIEALTGVEFDGSLVERQYTTDDGEKRTALNVRYTVGGRGMSSLGSLDDEDERPARKIVKGKPTRR